MAEITASEEKLLLEEDGNGDTSTSSRRRHSRRSSSSDSDSRGKRRKKYKRETRRESRSSSSSDHSRASTSSRDTVTSHRNNSPDRVHPKDITDRKSLLEKKIPNVLEFCGASLDIPEAPVLKSRESRRRVQLKPNVLMQFEEAAKGRHVPKDERTAFESAIPLPNSLAALPPMVDEEISGERTMKGFLYESQLGALHASVLVALSALALSVNTLPEGDEASKSKGYASAAMTVLGSVAHDITTWRREFVLKSLRVDPSSVVPSLRSETVSLNAHQAYSGERHPVLFGPELLNSIVKRHGSKNELLSALSKMGEGKQRTGAGKTSGASRSARPKSARRPDKSKSENPKAYAGRISAEKADRRKPSRTKNGPSSSRKK